MFSPSLLTAILHSYWELLPGAPDLNVADVDAAELADVIRHRIGALPDGLKTGISIPVVGRIADRKVLTGAVQESATLSDLDASGAAFLWGRLPLQQLADQMIEGHTRGTGVEYLDLATTIEPAGPFLAGRNVEDACGALLGATAMLGSEDEDVRVAVIDSGDPVAGAIPQDFHGRLIHLTTTDIVMSAHAMTVLWVLLERLDKLQILNRCAIVCSLARKPDPSNMIGRECFKHAGIVELGQAFERLDRLGTAGEKPLVTNLSLGTHVGPHNGDSPLEELLRVKFRVKDSRYLIAAAGNDGLRGVTARRLVSNVREFLRVVAGGHGSRELLIELWWKQPGGISTLSVAVYPRFSNADPVCQPIRLNARSAGAVMSARMPHHGFVVQSLCHANCHGDMHCIAFGFSIGGDRSLDGMYFDIELQSSVDVVVNAWIVVSTDKTTAFSIGTADGTITVPATEQSVLSVAGAELEGPWAESSRGPVGVYDPMSTSLPTDSAPLIAHDPYADGIAATSFAAPKAAAEVANLVLDVAVRGALTGTADIAMALLNQNVANPKDNRTGYGTLPD